MPIVPEFIPRKLLPVFCVLDIPMSMDEEQITRVNTIMLEMVDLLREKANKLYSSELRIAVLQSYGTSQWLTDGLISPEDFSWQGLKASGASNFGNTLNELNNKLSREQFLVSEVGFKAPVIIFMSDGEPTDDYESALNKIKSNNKWFQVATKIAIAVGDDANIQVLQKIAGNKEAVIKVDDLETLKKLIRVVSVTATMIGSKSRTEDDQTDKVISKIEQDMGDEIQVPSDPEISQENNTQDSSDSLSGQDVDDSDPWGNGVWD